MIAVELKDRERAILVFIGRNQPTTYAEVAAGVGLKSTSSVYAFVIRLERRGFIVRGPQYLSRTLSLGREYVVSARGRLYRWVQLWKD